MDFYSPRFSGNDKKESIETNVKAGKSWTEFESLDAQGEQQTRERRTMDVVAWTQTHWMALIYGMVGLMILSWIWIGILASQIKRLQKRLKKRAQGDVSLHLDEALQSYKNELKSLQEKIQQILEDLDQQKGMIQESIGPLGVVRFNAFDEMGGDLSFALAILNRQKNGVVISSIYGREEQRTYAKPVENGTSVYLLSEEEKEALRRALQHMERH
jgi:methyl-accepting chemotaxis protein